MNAVKHQNNAAAFIYTETRRLPKLSKSFRKNAKEASLQGRNYLAKVQYDLSVEAEAEFYRRCHCAVDLAVA